MVEGECDQVVQELNLTSKRLVTKKETIEMVEASLAAKFAYLGKSTIECVELYHLLAEAHSQKEKDLAKAQMALDEAKVRVTKVEKALNDVEAGVIGAKARAQVVEEVLGQAKD